MDPTTQPQPFKVRLRKCKTMAEIDCTRYYVHVDGDSDYIGWVVKGTAQDETGEFTNWVAYEAPADGLCIGRQLHMGEATRRDAISVLLQKLDVGTYAQRRAWMDRQIDKAYGVKAES